MILARQITKSLPNNIYRKGFERELEDLRFRIEGHYLWDLWVISRLARNDQGKMIIFLEGDR